MPKWSCITALPSGTKRSASCSRPSLASHGLYRVISVDQFQDTGDIVMWDATVERDEGILETTHIVILGDDGLILRHIPRIRGYWGM